MTQIHVTLEQTELQELISNSGADEASKFILTKLFNQLMEKQRDECCNASAYERGEHRHAQRNGYYERQLTTRIGTITLNVPHTRDGAFSTDIFERYPRNEQALVSTILEMYVTGVSTRKVGKVVESLCGKHVSKSYVSSITKRLDAEVQQFKAHRIDKQMPYLMTDVIYIKVREDRHVVSKAVHIAIGVDTTGFKHILGFMISDAETEETWTLFFESMLQRGLSHVKIMISDAHKGQVNAIRKAFTASMWQRCQVHFMRNVLDKLPRKNTAFVRNDIKNLFRITDIDAARFTKQKLIELYEAAYPNMCETLDEGFEDAFQYTSTKATRYNRLKSTNLLERLNNSLNGVLVSTLIVYPSVSRTSCIKSNLLNHR